MRVTLTFGMIALLLACLVAACALHRLDDRRRFQDDYRNACVAFYEHFHDGVTGEEDLMALWHEAAAAKRKLDEAGK